MFGWATHAPIDNKNKRKKVPSLEISGMKLCRALRWISGSHGSYGRGFDSSNINVKIVGGSVNR